MQTEQVVFNCPDNVLNPPGRTLKMCAKRYWRAATSEDDSGLTLLFVHGIGANKEQWEPTIDGVLCRLPCPVREAWAVEWQTCGDSAVLNREVLSASPGRAYLSVSAFEWSEAIAEFIQSPYLQGRRIVLVGHSAGAVAAVLTLKHLTPSSVAALIQIETTATFREDYYRKIEDRLPGLEAVVKATRNRRETWSSRDEALEWMKARIPWKLWDPRVLRGLVDHALESIPGAGPGVRLKNDRKLEAITFPHVEPPFAAAEELQRISTFVPVHFIWASGATLVPDFMRESFESRKIAASVRMLEGGHMIVQEKPDAVAEAICAILNTSIHVFHSRL
ncbi:Alpha/beta hydrolase fold-1 [Roridomyces roridus]|uniref:Alpha/beta hydrolase fold-1 n=1 Tax=Roridomyces roridus TaxID=1738132 RepID=A0AAD7FKW3_9AGAR|nr:Alpha/beta hydrolase fold-1 [Roridomyces roridus]